MTIEEQLLGKKLSGPESIILRIALCVFIMLGLIYIGGALHDATHVH